MHRFEDERWEDEDRWAEPGRRDWDWEAEEGRRMRADPERWAVTGHGGEPRPESWRAGEDALTGPDRGDRWYRYPVDRNARAQREPSREPRRVPAVRERFTGRPPRNYRRSDERIREDICDRLMQSWIDAEDVDVQVKDGEVTLSGTIPSRAEKHALEQLAEDVLGVVDVQNQLRLARRPDVPVPTQPAAAK